MAKIIAIANQKGGVAKTTTTCSFSAGLKLKGYRVLAIDLDPQGNLSDSIGAEMYELPTIFEVMKGDINICDAIQKLKSFDIVPSNIMLAGAEQEFSQTGKEHKLDEMIEPVKNDYDFILIDTPPSLGTLTINAFTCANEVIIPTTAGIFAINGISQLNNTIKNVQKYCNPNVKIEGILLTRFVPQTNLSQGIKDLAFELGEFIETKVFKTYIRNTIIVDEAQINKVDIFTYKKDATVSIDYNNFIDEYLKGAL